MRTGGARPLRAVVLGVAAVVLGLGAHDAAGGAPVVEHAPLLLGVGLGAAAVAALVDRLGGVTRTAGVLGASGALGAGQAVLHLAVGDDGGGHAMAGMDPAAHLFSPAMLVAHVIVTLAVTAGIAGAEATVAAAARVGRALAVLARRVRRRTLLLALSAPPGGPRAARPRPAPGHGSLGAPGLVVTRIHPLRGPPSSS